MAIVSSPSVFPVRVESVPVLAAASAWLCAIEPVAVFASFTLTFAPGSCAVSFAIPVRLIGLPCEYRPAPETRAKGAGTWTR